MPVSETNPAHASRLIHPASVSELPLANASALARGRDGDIDRYLELTETLTAEFGRCRSSLDGIKARLEQISQSPIQENGEGGATSVSKLIAQALGAANQLLAALDDALSSIHQTGPFGVRQLTLQPGSSISRTDFLSRSLAVQLAFAATSAHFAVTELELSGSSIVFRHTDLGTHRANLAKSDSGLTAAPRLQLEAVYERDPGNSEQCLLWARITVNEQSIELGRMVDVSQLRQNLVQTELQSWRSDIDHAESFELNGMAAFSQISSADQFRLIELVLKRTSTADQEGANPSTRSHFLRWYVRYSLLVCALARIREDEIPARASRVVNDGIHGATRSAKEYLSAYLDYVVLEERMQGRLPAVEGIRLVKELPHTDKSGA